MAGTDGSGPFDTIDSRLTIYALANGLDLRKEPRRRRLAWYRDGREREVRIVAGDGAGGFEVAAAAFRTGQEEDRNEEALATVASADDLAARLGALLEEARARADEL